MFVRSIRFPMVCFTLLCGCTPLLAQSSNYHVELSDRTSGTIIFVNDSKKPIEAFSISGRCGDHNGANDMYDGLNSAWDKTIEPGNQMPSSRLVPQPVLCDWEAKVDAVIYTDGTYEGDENAIRILEAKRDGIVTGVRYWAARLNRIGPTQEDLEAILAAANRMYQEDSVKANSATTSNDPQFTQLWITRNYWSGRSQAADDIAINLKWWLSKYDPEESRKRLMQIIKPWQKKIDNDVALKKLDAAFPLPTALAQQSEQLQAQAQKITISPIPEQ
jgi:hypothetical protein